jgi:ubiquinone/menaquinone biosynthesis C-methylase UbiE
MRVWNHLNETDLRKAIREARRVLKKNGYLIFDIEEKSLLRKIAGFVYKIIFRPTGYKIYQYSIQEIARILKEEGFKIEKGKFLYHRVGRQVIMRCKLMNKP